MAEQCIMRQGSDPPVCGVHNVQLVQRRTSHGSVDAGVGDFAFLVCPTSGEILNDSPAKPSGA
jgi:hypothetical protein